MGIKQWATKKIIKHKTKDLPKEQQQLIEKLVEENPELFTKISEEIKALTKEGVSEEAASMKVMMTYRNEIQKVAMDGKKQPKPKFPRQ